MSHDDLDRLCEQNLARRASGQRLRQRVAVHPLDSTHLTFEGRSYVNFASNNYLGLTHHPRVIDAIQSALAAGAGSGAAGLVSGYTDLHQRAEQTIAHWKGTESAVLLPSGYQTNIAAIQTLAAINEREPAGQSSVRFLLDKLVHASLVDAVRATGSDMRVFPHNRFEKLRRLLSEAPENQLQIVVTESIFSMDGDAADVKSLAELKNEFHFVLLLDEAHASGVYGKSGAGYAAEAGFDALADVSTVTFSKSMGLVGGAICASQRFCDAVINLGRAYIFSTSVPPMIAAGIEAAIDVCQTEPARQIRVRELARRVRAGLANAGLAIPLGDSPIIPIILGDESRALAAAEALRSAGLWVIAVRPPTVPPGGSRLRITLSCDHTDGEVDELLKRLTSLPL